MGHIHLGVLPKTRRWQDVVALLADGAAPTDVIEASGHAAERDLLRASSDPVFVEAVRLLLAIPLAARSEDFGDALRQADLSIGSAPDHLDLVMAASRRLDDVASEAGPGSDVGDLVGRALVTTVSQTIGDALPALFDATPEDVQAVARSLSSPTGISAFTRTFFDRFVAETLSYWLDRTLALQIGPNGPFDNVRDRSAFDVALQQYTGETTRIIKEFSGGWYGKNVRAIGSVDRKAAAAFGAVCLKKIVAELGQRRGSDG